MVYPRGVKKLFFCYRQFGEGRKKHEKKFLFIFYDQLKRILRVGGVMIIEKIRLIKCNKKNL